MLRVGLLIASLLLVTGAVAARAGTPAAAEAAPASLAGARSTSSSCGAAPVHYESTRRAGGAPWIAVQAGHGRLEGYLYEYHSYLGDGRVNRSEGVVLRAGEPEKIAWFSTVWGGSHLTVVGKRLDGSGAFRKRFRAAVSPSGFYPSGIRIPTAGCWELTLRTVGWVYRVVVEAVDPAPPGTCEPTPVPVSRFLGLVPERSGISAGWGWWTEERGALLYAGGRTPAGGNTKVLWRATKPGGLLTLRGLQIDGNGAFRQAFKEAASPIGYWPSIVVVPTPGCWLLTVLGIGETAGIVVVRVVPA